MASWGAPGANFVCVVGNGRKWLPGGLLGLLGPIARYHRDGVCEHDRGHACHDFDVVFIHVVVDDD